MYSGQPWHSSADCRRPSSFLQLLCGSLLTMTCTSLSLLPVGNHTPNLLLIRKLQLSQQMAGRGAQLSSSGLSAWPHICWLGSPAASFFPTYCRLLFLRCRPALTAQQRPAPSAKCRPSPASGAGLRSQSPRASHASPPGLRSVPLPQLCHARIGPSGHAGKQGNAQQLILSPDAENDAVPCVTVSNGLVSSHERKILMTLGQPNAMTFLGGWFDALIIIFMVTHIPVGKTISSSNVANACLAEALHHSVYLLICRQPSSWTASRVGSTRGSSMHAFLISCHA